jgi:hypothetical protein
MKISEKALFTAAVLFGIFKLAVFIWAIPRGFDITDEGFLINGYKHWSIYNTFDFYRFLNLFFDTARINIMGYRVLRIVLECSSTFIFTIAFYSWYGNRKKEAGLQHSPAWLFAFCALALVFQSVTYRMAGYNEFAYTLVAFSWSALLLSERFLSNEKIQFQIARYIAYGLVGVLTACLIFVKLPTALIEIVLIAFNVISYQKSNRKNEWLYFFVFYLVGIITVFVWYVGGWNDILNWYNNYVKLMGVYRNMEYTAAGLLGTLFTELLSYGITFTIATTFSVLFYRLLRAIANIQDNWWHKATLHFLFILLSAFVADKFFGLHSYQQFLHYSVLLFGAIIYQMAIQCADLRLGQPLKLLKALLDNHENRTLALLFLLSFIIIGGSVASFSEMFFIFLTPAMLAFLIPLYTGINSAEKGKVQALMSVLLALMAFNFIYFNILHPCGLPGNILSQKYALQKPEKIMVDKETADMLSSINRTIESAGYHKGGPIIGFDFLCGLVYLSGGYSPGCPCYVPGNEKKMDFDCHFLNTVTQTELPEVTPVFFSAGNSEKNINCLQQFSQSFNYQIIDSVFNTYTANPENAILLGEGNKFIKISIVKRKR